MVSPHRQGAFGKFAEGQGLAWGQQPETPAQPHTNRKGFTMIEMQAIMGRWAKLCVVPALLALGGCGGPATPCGADIPLENYVMFNMLNNRFKPAHIREVKREIVDARKEERKELEAERKAASEANREVYRSINRRGGPSAEEAKAALDEAKAALDEFDEETRTLLAELEKDIEENLEDEDIFELQGLYDVRFGGVVTTGYEEAPVSNYACLAWIESDLLDTFNVEFNVKLDARNGAIHVFL